MLSTAGRFFVDEVVDLARTGANAVGKGVQNLATDISDVVNDFSKTVSARKLQEEAEQRKQRLAELREANNKRRQAVEEKKLFSNLYKEIEQKLKACDQNIVLPLKLFTRDHTQEKQILSELKKAHNLTELQKLAIEQNTNDKPLPKNIQVFLNKIIQGLAAPSEEKKFLNFRF